ncbi:MAG: hypothetical protein ABWZ56_04645 [Flavobacterium sp.]
MKKNLAKNLPLLLLFILTISFSSCENEKVDLGAISTGDAINQQSDLFELLDRVTTNNQDPLTKIECIDFIYPFALIIYDSNLQPLQTISITGDDVFSNLLGTLSTDFSISISYPITTTLNNGDVISINNNSELKIAIDNCSKEDILSYCGGLFADCHWEVPYMEGQNNQYASGYFDANPDATIKFTYNNTTYTGTWVFLYLNDEFFLNINLEGNSLVSQYWNKNHKINFSETEIVFTDPTTNVTLKKICETQTIYTVGENGPSGGLVFYDKGIYSNGWRYIEVSTVDLALSQWGCYGTAINNASNSEIGSGYLNSVSIINYHNNLPDYYLNPSICNPANNGTLSSKNTLNLIEINDDWFLPSVEELNLLYTNLHLQNLGSFSSSLYWSSTQNDAETAQAIDFSNGTVSFQPKSESNYKTRAVRYF